MYKQKKIEKDRQIMKKQIRQLNKNTYDLRLKQNKIVEEIKKKIEKDLDNLRLLHNEEIYGTNIIKIKDINNKEITYYLKFNENCPSINSINKYEKYKTAIVRTKNNIDYISIYADGKWIDESDELIINAINDLAKFGVVSCPETIENFIKDMCTQWDIMREYAYNYMKQMYIKEFERTKQNLKKSIDTYKTEKNIYIKLKKI